MTTLPASRGGLCTVLGCQKTVPHRVPSYTYRSRHVRSLCH
jgi:hypothetical protein